MSNVNAQPSKGKLKYFFQQAPPNCHHCEQLANNFNTYKDAAEKRYNSLLEILAEHKVLLDKIIAQNSITDNISRIFPIDTEEKLKELDTTLAMQSALYIKQIKLLLAGNVERNLHQIFGPGVIMNFNVDGVLGKKRLRDFENVLNALIDVISTFSQSPDKALRTAFQRQKKKYFKQNSRNNSKNKENANEGYMLKGLASLEQSQPFENSS